MPPCPSPASLPALKSRSLTLAIPLVLLAALAAAGCDRQGGGGAQPPSEGKPAEAKALNGRLDISNRGARMPEATLTDPAGKRLRLADLEGQPVLVNLWATWCGPCVIEMPMLDALAEKERSRLRVLTVSQDIQGAEKVAPFFAERDYRRLEPWLDPDNTLGFHYGTGVLPTTVLYDSQGREVWRMIGGHDWSGARTTALLAETLETAATSGTPG